MSFAGKDWHFYDPLKDADPISLSPRPFVKSRSLRPANLAAFRKGVLPEEGP